MILSEHTMDMVRARVYLLIENRQEAKRVSSELLKAILFLNEPPKRQNVKWLIPLPATLREAMAKDEPNKSMDIQILDFYRNYNGEWLLR